MNENKIKVLYIAGPTRSGSTILSKILGEIDGFFNAGELIDIWDRGLVSNGQCGCKARMKNCEVWKAVISEAFGGTNGIDTQEMINLRNSAVHSRYIPRLIMIPWAKSQLESRLEEYLTNIKKLYRAIKSVTKSKVIIDSSKNPAYAYILAMIPIIDLYIVHLIRDPRATAFSWLRKKEGLWQTNPLETSLVWDLRNIATEMLQRILPENYLRFYYENFISQPKLVVEKISDLVKENASYLPFITENEVKLGVNHSIYGNPNRFQAGVCRLELDDEWKKMRKLDKFIVTTLTWPFLIRYGYPIIPRFLSSKDKGCNCRISIRKC